MSKKKVYDLVYLTNTPSFYKLNLMDEVGKRCKVLLVFYGYGAEAVNAEMEGRQWNFDFLFLNKGDSHSRSKMRVFCSIIQNRRVFGARRYLYAGWLAPEYNLFSFFTPKRKNVVVCESSILDVSFSGLKGWIKRRIISRMSAALPSGTPHDQLFKSINFQGPRYITGSVGIINKNRNRDIISSNHTMDGRCLYVGRLTEVKNLRLLIEAFNLSGRPLTIVGKGELEHELKSIAKPNISFIGFVDNERLGEIYQTHDLFILPSSYEPWGLVVEEAIYWGLPVVVSDRVGSGPDMVEDLRTGVIFKHDSVDDLNRAVDLVFADYQSYKSAVDAVDFAERDENQINAYLKLLK